MAQIFFPFQIRDMSPKAVRAAYSQLRAIANKRMARLEQQQLSREPGKRFPGIRSLDEEGVRTQLAEVSRYVRDETHTLRGAKVRRAETIAALRARGITNIDESNYIEYTKFMDAVVDEYGAKAYDSGDANDVFSAAQRIGIPTDLLKENIDYFFNNQKALARMKPVRSAQGATLQALSRKISRLGGVSISEYNEY